MHSRCGRRVAWRRPKAPRAAPSDGGPALLGGFARELAARVASVLQPGLEVRSLDTVRCADLPLTSSDRVWHCDIECARVHCALDSDTHRTILEWILGGPGASAPTPIERTIVTECVDRLLSPSAHSRWHEGASWHEGAVWLSVLEIYDKAATASIRLFTAAQTESAGKRHPRLDDVPLDLCGQLHPSATRLGTLIELKRGTIVPIGDPTGAARACLRVGFGPAVFGTLGAIDGRRAIRLNGSAARAGSA